MSIEFKQIASANKRIGRMDIRGKKYATVAARVIAFREMCPSGAITTEIAYNNDDLIIIKATVCDEEGHVLATGHAYEREDSSQINRTSFVENCETSAIGRALAMIGIGSEESIASAEEMANALSQQNLCSAKELQILERVCTANNQNAEDVFPSWPEVTKKEYGDVMARMAALRIKK